VGVSDGERFMPDRAYREGTQQKNRYLRGEQENLIKWCRSGGGIFGGMEPI